MKINADIGSIDIFAALNSNIRLQVIQNLADKDMNIKQLAQATEVSSAIMTKHVKKLADAGIIETYYAKGRAGKMKMCKLVMQNLEIVFPKKMINTSFHEVDIPIGHYSHIDAQPTCGLATTQSIIGQFDDSKYFYSEERVNASILWFGTGSISYSFMNPLLISQQPISIEISMEISSEAPGYNPKWPSDIDFALSDIELGYWTSPGDFGEKPGRYTPTWWSKSINQYGLLKIIRIDANGTYMDGERISETAIHDIPTDNNIFTLKMGVNKDSIHPGGLTIFGKGFGNYDQNIHVRIEYEQRIKV